MRLLTQENNLCVSRIIGWETGSRGCFRLLSQTGRSGGDEVKGRDEEEEELERRERKNGHQVC